MARGRCTCISMLEFHEKEKKEPTEKESERWNFLSIGFSVLGLRRRSVNKSLPTVNNL